MSSNQSSAVRGNYLRSKICQESQLNEEHKLTATNTIERTIPQFAEDSAHLQIYRWTNLVGPAVSISKTWSTENRHRTRNSNWLQPTALKAGVLNSPWNRFILKCDWVNPVRSAAITCEAWFTKEFNQTKNVSRRKGTILKAIISVGNGVRISADTELCCAHFESFLGGLGRSRDGHMHCESSYSTSNRAALRRRPVWIVFNSWLAWPFILTSRQPSTSSKTSASPDVSTHRNISVFWSVQRFVIRFECTPIIF
jgi:hypothetical protein